MKRSLIFILIMALAFQASSLEFNQNIDSAKLIYEAPKKINVEVTIANATPGEYNFYTLSDMRLEPQEVFRIENKTSKKNISFMPNENLDIVGTYVFTYTLNHRGVEKIDKKFSVEFIRLKDAIDISARLIDPGDKVAKIIIKNKKDVEIKDIKATFSSILFNKSIKVSVGPKQEKEYSVEVNRKKAKKIKAGVYVLNSKFFAPKGEVNIQGNFYIGRKEGIATLDDSSGFFIRTRSISKVNTGNVLKDVKITVKKNIISRLFTSFSMEPLNVKREGLNILYTWEKKRLGPSEVFQVKVKTNYLLPIIVIFVLVTIYLFVKKISQQTIEIRKKVSPVKTKGGEFALRIQLSIRAKKRVENVSVIDKVPPVVKIYKKFGTFKPDKIDVSNRRLHWNLGDLEPQETRIISYIVYSKVGFVGKFSLPQATAVFERDGEVHEEESNKVFFMSEQAKAI